MLDEIEFRYKKKNLYPGVLFPELKRYKLSRKETFTILVSFGRIRESRVKFDQSFFRLPSHNLRMAAKIIIMKKVSTRVRRYFEIFFATLN